MIKLCPICGEDNLSIARFCSSCGAVIAHIEPTVSGFGTAQPKHSIAPQDPTPAPAGEDDSNDRLAGRMVDLAQTPQFPQKPWSAKKLLTGPYAVAGLAGLTILGLTASLAWIVQGTQAFSVSAPPTSSLSIPPSSSPSTPSTSQVVPTPYSEPMAPTVSVQASSQSLPSEPSASEAPSRPKEADGGSTSPATQGTSAPATPLLPKEHKPQKQKHTEQTPKQNKPLAANASSPSSSQTRRGSTRAPPHKVDNVRLRADAPLTSEVMNSPRVVDSSASGSKANQIAAINTRQTEAKQTDAKHTDAKHTDAKPAETRPKELKGSVEALCSDRSNFLTRGFCQNQYCADALRKNDQTCQKLRQYELARQNITY